MNRTFFSIALLATLIVAGIQLNASAQTLNPDGKDPGLASMSAAGSSVRWDVKTSYPSGTLTVAAPDGRVFRKELKAGSAAEFATIDNEGNKLPDGHYIYELRLAPALSKQAKDALKAERGKDDDAEDVRSTRKRTAQRDQSAVQSGSFTILNGAIVNPGMQESRAQPVSKAMEQPRLSEVTRAAVTKLRQHHISAMLMPDQVIPDDLIVQGSLCVGFDCVNGEVFDFDTIRMKENNTRVKFDDTSTAAGFPANDWQLTANDSASGGASKFSIEDTTGARIPFTLTAGAPTDSVFVASTGRVGFRTSTPVLDLHVATSNTPAHRLEQTSAGGFTAQTFDIGANEANFFIRDVTSGSRLPFRIRPGAATSSIDINANGNVGIGTASPAEKLDVVSDADPSILVRSTKSTPDNATMALRPTATGSGRVDFQSAAGVVRALIASTDGTDNMMFFTGGVTERMRIDSTGRVGIATSAPTDTLSVNGTASKTGGGSWAVFSDERLKTIKGDFNSGLKALMQLQPIRYEYRRNNALQLKSEGEHIGFGAQAVQRIIPEAVTKTSEGYLQVNNDPILWTMLNAIKEQQKEIEDLKGQVRQLRAASRRRR